MESEDGPRTLAEYPYVRVRIRCAHCPERIGSYSLARLAARFGPDALLQEVLWELTRSCKWQVRPETKRRKYVPYCKARYCDLDGGGPPDEPPEDLPPGRPRLRLVA